MTLHGDRVTCDVPRCEKSTPDTDPWFLGWRTLRLIWDVCPACRARHTDDELRDLLARKEAE